MQEASDGLAGAPAKVRGHQTILFPSFLFPNRFPVQGRLLPNSGKPPVGDNILSNIVQQIPVYTGKKKHQTKIQMASLFPSSHWFLSMTFRVVLIVPRPKHEPR